MLAPLFALQSSAAFAATNTTGSTTLTIQVVVAIKSVTVSPSAATFSNCSFGTSTASALGFPNGLCSAGVFTIVTGTAPSNVSVNGADALPSDNGQHWALCSPGAVFAPACNGFTVPPATISEPGIDQYDECTAPGTNTGCTTSISGIAALSNTPSCDQAFNSPSGPVGCNGVPAQTSSTERIYLTGPGASSDTSSSFSTSATWSVS